MDFDYTPYFKKYEALAKMADDVFERVKAEYPECVTCREECADCCHALFDLTLIEALYLNHRFNERFTGAERKALIDKANRIDRQTYKIKRSAYKDLQSGTSEEDILERMGKERVRCPLLNEKDLCDLYDHRPITCRLYGIPTAIGGKGHTCGMTRFKPGEAYPTANLGEIQRQLLALSDALAKDMKAENVRVAEVLVPLSMALITQYDDAYFGFSTETEKEGQGDDGS